MRTPFKLRSRPAIKQVMRLTKREARILIGILDNQAALYNPKSYQSLHGTKKHIRIAAQLQVIRQKLQATADRRNE